MGSTEVVIENGVRVPPTITIDEALQRMEKDKASCVLITRKRELLGILTERDIQLRVIGKGHDPQKLRVNEVMTSPIVTVPNGTPLSQMQAIMNQHHINHLPVTDVAQTRNHVSLVYHMLAESALRPAADTKAQRAHGKPTTCSL